MQIFTSNVFFFVIARQTKALNVRPVTNRHSTNSNRVARPVLDLPSSKSYRGQGKVKSNIKKWAKRKKTKRMFSII